MENKRLNFIDKSQKVHGEKYDYSKVDYKKNQENVVIVCKIHGEFTQMPMNHIKGCGCPSCSKVKKWTKEEFIKKSEKVHNNKYNYDEVIFVNTKEKVSIICPSHGLFKQSPGKHLIGIGCSTCSWGIKRMTQEEFEQRSQEVHGNRYDYSKVDYKNNNTKVTITCKKHGDFLQTPLGHISKQNGCPKCNLSKGEEKIMKILEINGVEYEHQKKFDDCKNINVLPFDFYLPKYNLAIEYDGQQHYFPNNYLNRKNGGIEKREMADQIRNNYCKENGIKLLRIWYQDFNNIEQILNNLNVY